MKNEQQDQEIEQLFLALTQVRQFILRQSAITEEEKIASSLQFSALNVVQNQLNITNNELAAAIFLSKSSTTQLVERLVKNGLIEKKFDTIDKRVIRLNITEVGKKEVIEMKEKILEKIKSVLAKIPPQDQAHLIRIYHDLAKTLQKEANDRS